VTSQRLVVVVDAQRGGLAGASWAALSYLHVFHSFFYSLLYVFVQRNAIEVKTSSMRVIILLKVILIFLYYLPYFAKSQGAARDNSTVASHGPVAS